MYFEIEKKFKKKSKDIKSRWALVVSVLVFSIIYTVVMVSFKGNIFLKNFFLKEMFIWLIIGAFIFWMGCYLFVFIYVKKHTDWKIQNILSIGETKEKYLELIHQSDIKILKDILKEYNINTRPKILEAIRHYQTILPRKTVSSNLLSILAFSISVLSLIFSDFVFASKENLQIVAGIIFLIVLGYWITHFINKNYFKFLSKEDLHVRIESSLSEMFMKYYEK